MVAFLPSTVIIIRIFAEMSTLFFDFFDVSFVQISSILSSIKWEYRSTSSTLSELGTDAAKLAIVRSGLWGYRFGHQLDASNPDRRGLLNFREKLFSFSFISKICKKLKFML